MGHGHDQRSVEPFQSAEEAWFWTCAALQARAAGAHSSRSGVRRPCDPEDILLCVDRLVRTRQLNQVHMRVLGQFGLEQTRPSMRCPKQQDARLWNEAIFTLSALLAQKHLLVEI
jgi:hypothetical protein